MDDRQRWDKGVVLFHASKLVLRSYRRCFAVQRRFWYPNDFVRFRFSYALFVRYDLMGACMILGCCCLLLMLPCHVPCPSLLHYPASAPCL